MVVRGAAPRLQHVHARAEIRVRGGSAVSDDGDERYVLPGEGGGSRGPERGGNRAGADELQVRGLRLCVLKQINYR